MNAVSVPMVSSPLPDEPAAERKRQHGGRSQRQPDRGLVGGLPALRVVACVGGRARAAAKSRPARASRPSARSVRTAATRLLHVVVEVGEAVERAAPRLVHAARDDEEGERHERKRQQRDEAQAPVHAERHHRHDEHQRQRAVEAGEESLARRHLHGVDVVGRVGHEVAGTPAMEERRPLQRQALVELRAQLDAQAKRRAEQLQAPADAQEVDRRGHREQDRELLPQRGTREAARDQPVDDVPDAPRHNTVSTAITTSIAPALA